VAEEHLDRMLAIEAEHGVKATYHVVARLLSEVRHRIEAGGHALAFHSYDHRIDRWWLASRLARRVPAQLSRLTNGRFEWIGIDQLSRCREVDARIRGYRPPQSRITRELNPTNLSWHNFEWLASSKHSLGLDSPTLVRRLVKTPILLDDYSLHTGQLTYDQWEARLLQAARNREFLALSLHDCYGKHWIPDYPSLIEKLKELGSFATLDEIADGLFLAHAV
jgi:peptidoglycan/xylan/chitin deacetylase (PgdA/CDA1 family)